MTRIPTLHEPTPEFRARLEGRIVKSMRRSAQPDPARRTGWRRLRAAAVIMAAVGLGAAAGAVPAQVQESRARDQLVAAAEAEVQLAQLRAELARTQLAAVQRQHQVGAAGRAALTSAEAELARMHAGLERSRLNLQEVQASAAPVRDDLAAPLVRGRDFVRERMLLDLHVAQQQMSAAEQALAHTESSNRLGVVSGLVVHEARAELTRARAGMHLLMGRLQLRQQALAERLAPADVTQRAHRLELVQAALVAEEQHKLAAARLALVHERAKIGQSDQIEVLSAELEVSKRALELQRIMAQLRQHDAQDGA